jgi:hypothetical protein
VSASVCRLYSTDTTPISEATLDTPAKLSICAVASTITATLESFNSAGSPLYLGSDSIAATMLMVHRDSGMKSMGVVSVPGGRDILRWE